MRHINVILSTYNRAELLGCMIDSILAQTYREFELLVVDDASTDHTSEIVHKYNDTRIRYIRLPDNQGVGNARNVGIDHADAPVVVFVDDDDTLHPDFLATAGMGLMHAPPNVGFLWTWKQVIRSKDDQRQTLRLSTFGVNSPSPRPGVSFFRTLAGGSNGLVVRSQALAEVGGFDPELRAAGDTELLIRLAQRYDYMIIPQALYNYRYRHTGSGQLTESSLTRAKALELICRRHEHTLRRFPSGYQRLCTRSAKMYFQFGDVSSGRRMMQKQWGVFPPRLRSYALWLFLEIRSMLNRT